MAFWSNWFKPTCPSCNQKITGEAVSFEDQQICASCHAKILEDRARQAAEVEARRLAEEEARRRFEERKVFGPRE